MGQEAQLDLGIVGREEHGAGRSDEGAADGLAARGTHGDVLQVRVGGGEPSRGGPGLIETRMDAPGLGVDESDRKSTRLNSSHGYISYAVFCLKKKNNSTTEELNRRRQT